MNIRPPQQQNDRKISRSKVESRPKGFALVLVLWILSLLTIMAGSFALTMRRESTIVAGIKDNAGAVAAAEAGIAVAEMMLLHPEQNKHWRTDGNIYQVDFGNTQIRLRLLSEAGKIDINKADPPLLLGLIAQVPVEEDLQAKLIGAILDWRDKDDLLNIEGAEKKEYRDAGLKYHPRNKPFQTVEELQMVLGMDGRVFNWLEPLITVYSGQAQVNLKLASANVLNIVPGLDASLIASFVAARLESGKNGLPAPEFPASLVRGGASANETVTIVSEARMVDETSALVTATVAKLDATQSVAFDGIPSVPFKVLKWQRNPANEKSLFTDEMSEFLVKQYAEPELSD
ncbi:general secretion pathway protein GspK [Methyloglobulus sp.]|uniref:general secretion pathway protein GspK n=1 Tax=Methyloglobulus sp. TaxID=2518622 RepID=UPI003988D8BF